MSGLPHAVVKQAENFRVRELVKKIESHPHREALQADLQKHNANNPFSDESKAMIREMGNVELFELCETIPKSAMLRMPSLLESRHPLRSTREMKKKRYTSLNKSGRNAPKKLRSDFREAVTIVNRLHRESGEERPEPIPPIPKVAFVFFFQYLMVVVE